MISRYSIKQYVWNLLVNGAIMSYIFPTELRILLLRVLGCKMGGVIHPHCMLLTNKIMIGKGSYINRECLLDNAGADIVIGDNCAIACRVTIHTTNHDYSNPKRRSGKITSSPVIIKDGSWVGSNVIILPGTIINEGCVVASGSIVKGTLDKNGLYAGIPARRIKDI